MMDSLRRIAESNPTGKLPRNVYWLLEEFPQLPMLPNMQKYISIVRSMNMHIVIVAQDKTQIEAIYGEDAPAIFNNLGTEVFIRAKDKELWQYYSQKFGNYTVDVKSFTNTKSGSQFGGSYSTARTLDSVPLFRPEDIGRWSRKHGHLVTANGRLYALSAPDLSQTFVQKTFGMGSIAHNDELLKKMAARRTVKNQKPAERFELDDTGVRRFLRSVTRDIGRIRAAQKDPRFN
jgi:hypothetical protein